MVPRRTEGTVREILPPWHVLQQKLQKGNAPTAVAPANEVVNRAAQEALAAQEAANATWGTAEESINTPPSSGVRVSDPGAPPAAFASATNDPIATPQPGTGEPDSLSFKVYTLAQLERRSDAPVSMRSSTDLSLSGSLAHWQRARTALVAFVSASLAWFRTKGDRPRAAVALRQPFDNLGDELQVAVEMVDWKRLGVSTGIVVGATLTLLFAVLTVAELTDDLKPPGTTSHLASSDTATVPGRTALDQHGVAPATNMAAMGAQPVPQPAPIAEPPPPAAATNIVELDELDEPSEAASPAPRAKKPAAKRRRAAAKPKASKLTMRSAPF